MLFSNQYTIILIIHSFFLFKEILTRYMPGSRFGLLTGNCIKNEKKKIITELKQTLDHKTNSIYSIIEDHCHKDDI